MALKDVEIALSLKRELEIYDSNKDRSVLIKALRDQFIMMRHNAAVEVEKNKLLAMEILVNRMAKMSDAMLLRTLSLLSDIGGFDFSLLNKASQVGPMINMNQTNLGISVEEGNPIKGAGELLESLEDLANHFRGKTINLKQGEDYQKSDSDNSGKK